MAPKAAESRLGDAQTILADLAKDVRRLNKPPIGPLLNTLSGTDSCDSVVATRLVKHHPVGVAQHPDALHAAAIYKMLKHDSEGLSSFDYRAMERDQRRDFLLARAALEQFGKRVRRNYAFRFPSGESSSPSKGEVDLIAKLSSAKQWRVSFEAAADAAAVLYQNRVLKGVVKERFRKLHPQTYKFYADTWYAEKRNRFYVFKRMFLACCTIQNYSRISSVVKNSSERRPISMEPTFNMVAQLSFAADLRAALRECYGFDLDTRADLHRTLIRHDEKVTIDLRNASNSNWMCVIEALWPRSIVKLLKSLRTPICKHDGEYHYYNMLSPMGCGFTFEVMTITLLHLARVLDPGASVFGDDIIISKDVADRFLKLLSCTGWVVNDDKTFLSGNFRESCGAFYDLSTQTEILSYEFHEISDYLDVCTTCNKLRHIASHGQISSDLRQLITAAWTKLALLVPRVVMRPASLYHDNWLPDGVVVVPDIWFNQIKKETTMSRLYGLMYHREVTLGSKYSYEEIPSKQALLASDRILFAAYLRRGKSYDPTLRTHDVEPVLKTVITGGDGLLASNPLLSFI